MSENNKLPDGTPVVEFRDAAEFLTKRATLACPACGHNQWSVLSTNEPPLSEIGVGLALTNVTNAGFVGQVAPYVVSTCKKCFFIRMHNLIKISQWVAKGKPEFDENA